MSIPNDQFTGTDRFPAPDSASDRYADQVEAKIEQELVEQAE